MLSESKTRLEGSMLEGSTNDVVKGVTYIQVWCEFRLHIEVGDRPSVASTPLYVVACVSDMIMAA